MVDEQDVQNTEQETVDSSSESEETTGETEAVEGNVKTAVEPEAGSRAQARIRELLAENKQLKGQQQQQPEQVEEVYDPYQYQPEYQQPYPTNPQDIDTLVEARFQLKEAEQEHPELKTDDLFAKAVVGAWDKGKGGKTISEVAADLKNFGASKAKKEGVSETLKEITTKANAAVGQAGKSPKTYKTITREDIAKMSPSEYDANRERIIAAMEKGEL